MSWICAGCSERHSDGLDIVGFGLCKVCREKTNANKIKGMHTPKKRYYKAKE